jgi:hypothetical protein
MSVNSEQKRGGAGDGRGLGRARFAFQQRSEIQIAPPAVHCPLFTVYCL